MAFQLQRLEAMQQAGLRLMARPQLGRDVFPRGAPEGLRLVSRIAYDATLYDLLKAYGDSRRRVSGSVNGDGAEIGLEIFRNDEFDLKVARDDGSLSTENDVAPSRIGKWRVFVTQGGE